MTKPVDYVFCLICLKPEYLMKWLGYDSESNTWEPRENLNCSKRLADFESKRSCYVQSKYSYKFDSIFDMIHFLFRTFVEFRTFVRRHQIHCSQGSQQKMASFSHSILRRTHSCLHRPRFLISFRTSYTRNHSAIQTLHIFSVLHFISNSLSVKVN